MYDRRRGLWIGFLACRVFLPPEDESVINEWQTQTRTSYANPETTLNLTHVRLWLAWRLCAKLAGWDIRSLFEKHRFWRQCSVSSQSMSSGPPWSFDRWRKVTPWSGLLYIGFFDVREGGIVGKRWFSSNVLFNSLRLSLLVLLGRDPALTERVKSGSEASKRLLGYCDVDEMAAWLFLLLRLRSLWVWWGPALNADVKNSSRLTGYLRVGVQCPESSSGGEAFWSSPEGIMPAEIIAVSNFAGSVHFRQKSTSADQSRER